MTLEFTHSQAQILVGQRLHPDSPLYNMAFAFVFPSEVDADLFGDAWRRVADASDSLRTRIAEDDRGHVHPVVHSQAPAVRVLDLTGHTDAGDAFRHWCRERCGVAFPSGGPLVESVLARLTGGRSGWYLCQHHIVADAWATRLLYQQVAREYDALVRGDGVRPPALPPYYSTANALGVRPRDRDAARSHWAARAERPGRLAPLYGFGASAGTASTRYTYGLDEARARALEGLAGQDGLVSVSEELSRFALCSALLVGWLSRITGRTELGFDAPVAGRPTSEARRSLGLFIEMFPFAASVEPGDTIRSLGARCLEEAKLFLRHAVPGTSAPTSSGSSNVVLNYVPGAFGPFAGARPEVEWIHPGHGDGVHALRLQVHDFGGTGRYTFHLDVNEGAVPEYLRQRAPAHLRAFVEAVLDDPDRPLASIDLRAAEDRTSLARLNATGERPLPDRTVVARFRDRACREPSWVAVRQGRAEVTSGALHEQSEAVAVSLTRRGVRPGDRVAIAGRRSALAVAAILGALRARAAYVPLDPALPPARFDSLLRDSGARVLLVGEGVELPPTMQGVTPLAVAAAIQEGRGAAFEAPDPSLEDLAYLMYTSGSTGQPKGVLVEHGGLADYLHWADRTYVRGDRLTFPLFTSLAFDLTITSLFLPLLTGGTLEIYPEPDGPVDTAVLDVVAANTSDFIKLTPSHLSLLRRVGLDGSRIRRMVVGGEDLRTSLAAAVSEQFHDQVEIYNEYGPTEAVVGCVAHRFDPAIDTGSSVPIGSPADHVTVEILNEATTPVPEGVPGELWISRVGLARGYHRLPDQTAERFQPDPVGPGGRRYRTGDLVRMVRPGVLEYLGRIDRQVKISGFRVEPGEIEAALLSVPGIDQCAVVARHGQAAGKRETGAMRHCLRCGLPSTFPRADLDDQGVCAVCRSYESIRDRAQAYFRSMDDLRAIFAQSAVSRRSDHDCLMLFSGGKDSTYALCQLVEMGLRVYAFTLDNGFIAQGAKENIRRVAAHLGVPVEFATTPAMPAIFRDSLARFANVCNGCFKTIYTLSMLRARELGIPIIVTGLSRGQMFETRLTPDLFRDGRCSPEEVDAAVLAARKAYHRQVDEVSRSLDVRAFADDAIFEDVRFVDFYRYCDVGMDEVYGYLGRRIPWVRPADTGRSTNCLINDVGIYVHKKERGYHNYALPYSWDVRLGHKQREAALAELDDDIDADHVRKTLADIGYDESRVGAGAAQVALDAYYVAPDALPEPDLRRWLAERLPAQLIPHRLQRVDAIPLTPSGKVDERALAREAAGPAQRTAYRPPASPVEEFLAAAWQEELGAERVGGDDDFFERGGTSLTAMQVMVRLCREYDFDLPLATIFTHSRLADLARVAEDRLLADARESPPPSPSAGSGP